MSDHVSEDRLIDLATGLVPATESGSMLSHLRGCPACEDTFRGVCRDLERTKLKTAPAKRRVVAYGAVAALAAAILAAVVLIPILRSSRTVESPAAYWVPVEAEPVDLRTGSAGGDDAIFGEASAAYRRHEAERVVALLSGRSIPSTHDPLKLLYASALLKTGDAGGALDVLESLQVESLPQPYRDRAKWVQLGALRAQGLDADADALVAELASRPGEFSGAARSQSGSPTRKNPAQ